MTLEQKIKAFSNLGNRLRTLSEDEFLGLADKAGAENAWFTLASVKRAWNGIVNFLDEAALQKWVSAYTVRADSEKTVALVMAGNIPLVGFHDFLCVLISGHNLMAKLSSKDKALIGFIATLLKEIEPRFESKITFTDKLQHFDAVIATGSDNSSRYFDYYFGKYPNIIRKNRTSCAVLAGDETDNEFQKLAEDVFSYFGLGCRNVAKIFTPAGYNFSPLLKSWEAFSEVGNHHKYRNNYDYQKSIMLVNSVQFLDNGFVMITENEKLVSPIAVVFYESYQNLQDLKNKVSLVEDKLQCVVGKISPATIPFGQAQHPTLWNYADQIDTLQFLCSLYDKQ